MLPKYWKSYQQISAELRPELCRYHTTTGSDYWESSRKVLAASKSVYMKPFCCMIWKGLMMTTLMDKVHLHQKLSAVVRQCEKLDRILSTVKRINEEWHLWENVTLFQRAISAELRPELCRYHTISVHDMQSCCSARAVRELWVVNHALVCGFKILPCVPHCSRGGSMYKLMRSR